MTAPGPTREHGAAGGRWGGRREVRPVLAGILIVATLAAYANSWSVPFLFDDHATFLDNPALAGDRLSWAALAAAEHTGVGGRPLAQSTLVLNRAVSGDAPAGYHAGNLLIHCLAGLALFGWVRRTLGLPALAPRLGARGGKIALAVAAGWLLHPVQTQTVTYLSQRTEALMGLFYFATLYFFVRGVEGAGRKGWLGLAVVSCFAGMAAKEVMVTAPLMVLLYDRTFVAGSFSEAWRRRRGWYLALASSWVLLFFLMRGLGGRGVGYGLGVEWGHYALRAARAMAGYASLAVWPHPLVFDYGTDLGAIGAAELWSVAGVAALAGLTVAGLWRRPPLGFLGAWFLLTLAPTTSIVPIPLAPIAENRVYLPLAAIVTALVLLASASMARRRLLVGSGWIAALLVLTLARNHDYRSAVAIWTDTVAKRPLNARAHHNLGNALRDAGRLPEAERALAAALRLKPGYADAAAALGGVLGRMGRLDEAIGQCRRALELDPRQPDALNNLGGALWQKGDLAGAIAAYEAAVQARPRFAAAHVNLAAVLLLAGRPADAAAASEAALRVQPGFAAAHANLGVALRRLGRDADAIGRFEAALRLDPGLELARQHLRELRPVPAGVR